ncbi:uncharacterized protein LOC122854081 [Aphidius gifuensis]|uniref:uncharacterized protein LOC122854081 n=1 Tax=Aphidius gifuensis TaxID=684658 RepID=UPI001CDC11C0|nr:uncharacterized protein LOC122854081 [Aphidius gifuensis]
MSILDSSYFSLNRRALKFYGQWPHQSKLQNRCHRIVSFLAISSILIPKMYKLMDKIQNDWESLKTDKEREILNEHWKRGRSGLTIYASAIAGVLILFLTSPGVPKVFDIIAPLNESRPRVFPYETEYFVDQDDYYLYILMHSYMTVPVSIGLIVLFNTVMGSWIHHAAGMLAIVAYQLETIHNIPKSDERFSRYEKNQSIQKR